MELANNQLPLRLKMSHQIMSRYANHRGIGVSEVQLQHSTNKQTTHQVEHKNVKSITVKLGPNPNQQQT